MQIYMYTFFLFLPVRVCFGVKVSSFRSVIISISISFGVLTSHSRPSSLRGWWAARGRCGGCAGSGRSGGTRSTAASCGWVCCTRGRRSRTDTGPRARATAGARHLQSETTTTQQFSSALRPSSQSDINIFKIALLLNT